MAVKTYGPSLFLQLIRVLLKIMLLIGGGESGKE